MAMIRSIIDHAIKAHDVAVGVAERESGSKIYRRRLPRAGEDDNQDNQDDDEAAQSCGAAEGNSDVSVPLSAASKPACWYGVECRTKDHNSSHAARYDHAGLNTRRT